MIRVSAELSDGGNYLCGEKLSCHVKFENISSEDQSLAWAGAQLHCQCTYREDLVIPSSPPQSAGLNPATQTAFIPSKGEKGFTIMSSTPSVISCDLKLKPGEVKSYDYVETVPLECIPSFSGHLVRFTWKVSVGASRPTVEAKLIRIPFRVLTVPRKILSFLEQIESPHLTNPFCKDDSKEHALNSDIILQGLAHETSKRKQMTMELKTDSGVVGRLHLFKSVYRLGEEIIGAIDLSMATVPCLQMMVSLQAIEKVSDEHFAGQDRSRSSVTVSHATDVQSCTFASLKHFTVPIPSHVTPTFETAMVSLSWQLNFEFVTSSNYSSLGQMVTSPSKTHLEWVAGKVSSSHTSLDIPITVLATNPSQAESRHFVHQNIEI